ncbi:MAG: AAA family ATPase [Bacteroidetes bacterium]|nr:AAA family ATPase [Bacteroidota bacterium]MCL1968937.1 AAA family ATPase [Bacteroidota bacterium]
MNTQPLHQNKIVLVGFSGAGKSTVAKKIARPLNFSVIDTDKILEEKYKISVYDTFEKYGETVFRQLEYKILVEALQQENVVIATGGGAPCFFDAMKLINETAFSIYIEMSPKSLAQRLFRAKVTRPLTKNKTEKELLDFVNEQLAVRAPIYKQAHLTVRGEDLNLDELMRYAISDNIKLEIFKS